MRKDHDREVLTNYIGELIQHDTSIHVWSPLAEVEWHLITSLDDHSRYMMYADLWEKESSWSHIVSLKSDVTRFGCPLSYYVDNHSIFRFVERRDTLWRKHHQQESKAFVQWKEVLKDLGIDVIYALSSQAKGKIERPYRWLQDHLVRTCVREGINKIEQAREVLYHEIYLYNQRRVHSTTGEIPEIRFARATKEKRTLFRPFKIKNPYESMDDIFCYRIRRVVDSYRRISVNKLIFSLHGVPIMGAVELRISFNMATRMATIRFWYQNRLVDEQLVKADDLKGVQF